MTPTARFDSLRPGHRRSFRLTDPVRVLEASTLDDVVAVLAAAERAVSDGRWVAGWVAYEAAAAFDPAIPPRPVAGSDIDGLPLAWFAVLDGRGPVQARPSRPYRLEAWTPSVPAGRYAEDVEAVRRHISHGTCYQVNTTFRLHADFDGDAASFYCALIEAQHGGYGAFLDTGRWVVASASPELFFAWRGGRLESRPMKGTAARGRDLAEDRVRRSELASSEKDRAENTMIVDMVRNDLGRIARIGSVRVPHLWEIEKYDTVWQLTSTVTAEPRPGTDLVEVFAALFPPASITGAPKVAAMRIIAEREPDPRGVYCGAIGFGGPGPDGAPQWTFNVGIRTVLIDRHRGVARYGTGGGVTYHSTAHGEVAEAALKTAVLTPRHVDASLLETMYWSPDCGFRNLDRHLRRLAGAMDYFDVPGSADQIRQQLNAAVQRENAPRRVRLLVGRDGTVTVDTGPPPRVPERPVRLAVDDVPVDPTNPLLSFKTSDRRIYDAAAARHPDADDVVLVNDRGEVTETTVANLAVLIDGRWCTPPTSSGCLPGTRRAALIAAGRLVACVITVADLQRADATARFNALRDWEACELVPAGQPCQVPAGKRDS